MTIQSGTHAIESMQLEERRYPPPPEFAKNANAKPDIYNKPFEDFWKEEALKRVSWFQPFDKVLEWKLPYAKWFLGGKLNVCYNCVDRHVEAGRGDKVAYYWEGEPVDQKRTITFKDLLADVVRFANALKKLGVKKGTPVGIYMGMVPELPVAMLACARLGAPHTVVFGGFSADVLAGRLNDMECELLITQNEGLRKGNAVPLKKNVDAALDLAPKVKKAVVLRRTPADTTMKDGRDVWWQDLVKDASSDPKTCPCEEMDAEDLLYLLYTSGTTAKPKGIVHTTAGYLVGTSATHHYIFDIKPDSIYWCAADIGWVTGHSYIVYAPLCNGTTGVIYEGVPDFPDKARWWSIIERYKVDVLYTAPTAIRTHMKWGPEYAKKHDLSSLRLLGTVGEPINPEAWIWYRENIGRGKTPVVDTWWQTETGMILITPLPGVTTLKPGSATKPFPTVDAPPKVAEAAVCGRSDKQTGQAIVAFVTLRGGAEGSPEMLRELRNFVGEKIGKIAAPANIVFTPDLPKTRSGKIMRRLLRDVAENRPLGDTTTLADPAVVSEIDRRAKTEAAKEEASA